MTLDFYYFNISHHYPQHMDKWRVLLEETWKERTGTARMNTL